MHFFLCRIFLCFKVENIFILLFCILSNPGQSQEDIVYRSYGVNDGLPSSQVYMSLQDKKGYMWFCTDRGVTRFNGYQFETFPTRNGVGRNAVFRIQLDDLDRVWYSIFDKRWFYFENNQFIEYPFNNIIDSLVDGPIRRAQIIGFHMDRVQSVWFSYYKMNLDSLEYHICEIDSLGNVRNHKNILETPLFETIHLAFPQQTYHLVDSLAESNQVNAEQKRINALLLRHDITDTAISSKYFRRYTMDRHQINQFDPIKGFSSYPIDYKMGKTIFVDDHHNFWLCHPHKGAFCFENGDFSKPPQLFLKEFGVTSAFEDNEGGMWFTTLYNGIHYMPNKESKIYSSKMGLPNDYITSILKRNDTLFCGHSLGQLTQLTKKNGNYEIDHVYNHFQHVYNLEFTQNNQVIVTSAKESNELPPNFISSAHRSYFNQNDTIYSFDHRGTLFITFNGDTLNKIETVPQGERSLSYSSELGLLLGTNFGLYHLKNNRFIPLSKIHANFGERVQKIISSPYGWHVICTLGKGLIFWNEEKLYNLNTNDGLNSNLCNNIYLQNDSTLWVCSNIGVNKVSYRSKPDRIKVTESYTIENGLLSNEVNALFADSLGVWIGTREGLNFIPTNSLKKNTFPPPIHISKTTANNRVITDSASLHHSTNTVQIEFVGLSYRWSKNLYYRYRLLGSSDETWQKTNQTTLTFTSVPPGTYTFETVAVNASNIASTKPARFTFTILTPFWKSYWFYSAIILFLVIVLIVLNALNIRRIKRRAQLIKELEAYKNRSLRSQMNPHFIYNSLNTIQSFILKNDTDQSMSYLAKFSRLMRTTFKNSSDNLVSLKDDLKALKLYTDLEQMRYPKQMKIHYVINVPDTHQLFIPPLLIQPFVENAIIHGILPKNDKGNIWVNIDSEDNKLLISIKDDGVGFDVSKQIQARKNWNQTALFNETKGANQTEESGITVTSARIKLHNELSKNFDTRIQIETNTNENGVNIKFELSSIQNP